MSLGDVRTFYVAGEPFVVADLPAGAARVVARRADGTAVEAQLDGAEARFAGLPGATYGIEALDGEGALLAEELTTVGAHVGERPVLGVVTSFERGAVPEVLDWLAALRCTAVQFYDWMAAYAKPLGAGDRWPDPLGREVERAALESLTAGVRALGAAAQAYAPVYAVDPPFGKEHGDLLLYRNDDEAECLGDLLDIADPGNAEWQRHWLAEYGRAAGELGFDGFHLDTYGIPRAARTAGGAEVDLRDGYAAFLAAVRAAQPERTLSFNQVNGVPRAFALPAGPGFRYAEVWPPNDQWRHFEALIARSTAAGDPARGMGLACYPPVWAGERGDALRTVLLTEAISTCLGAALLVFGDRRGALSGAYYPRHERLSADEAALAIRWRRFALRCRDLFRDGEDTSWYEVGDENGAVVLPGIDARPEPAPGLFVRVARHDDWVAVSLVDLTGSASGSWSAPTAAGSLSVAKVQLLVPRPDDWAAEAAVLGAGADRFAPLDARIVPHREGRAVEVDVPLVDGWSVLRLRRAA